MQQLELDEYARRLCAAKKAYDYPAVTCADFTTLREKGYASMSEVEELIQDQLLSQDRKVVKDGLSNVIFWGYASTRNLQKRAVSYFRENVTDANLKEFKDVAGNPKIINLISIKNIGMPIFSQMSLTSKLLMFLYPNRFPVLDGKLARFAKKHDCPILKDITISGTSIPLEKNKVFLEDNIEIYKGWTSWCEVDPINRTGG